MFSHQHSNIKRIILRGGIVAYPTESCFGLGCHPSNIKSLKRLLKLKQRPAHKGLIILSPNLKQLKPLIKPLNTMEQDCAKQYWPGPYSLLLRYRRKASFFLRGAHDKIAVRISAYKLLQTFCQQTGPLVSTSANRAGQPSLKTARDVKRTFGKSVTIIKGKIAGSKKPSTVMDAMTHQRFR